jgi:quercetin dioxygenase-like cupin family protein
MAGDPTVVWMPGRVRTEIHLRSEDTTGAFCLLVDELPPGWSLPAHRHRGEAETMYVLSGAMAAEVDGDHLLVGAGETAHVPRGVLHSTRNAGAGPLHRVVIFSPAGMEDFFLTAGGASPDAVDARAALHAALAHGWEFADTP